MAGGRKVSPHNVGVSGNHRRFEVEVGERYLFDGFPGTIVAIIHEGKFSREHPAEQWAYLGEGIMVEDDAAGLICYPKSAHIEPLA